MRPGETPQMQEEEVKHEIWPRRLAFFPSPGLFTPKTRVIPGLFTPKMRVISAAEILLRIYKNWPIHTKDARYFCCGNSAADISKPHTFKWGTLADDVFPSANFTLPPKPRPPTGPI